MIKNFLTLFIKNKLKVRAPGIIQKLKIRDDNQDMRNLKKLFENMLS